jgi:hypothetical protein
MRFRDAGNPRFVALFIRGEMEGLVGFEAVAHLLEVFRRIIVDDDDLVVGAWKRLPCETTETSAQPFLLSVTTDSDRDLVHGGVP